MDQNIDFDDDSGLRSTRKSISSRRRKEQMDDDNLDAVLDSVIASTNKPLPQPRRNSKSREDNLFDSSSIKNSNSRSNPKTVSGWGDDDVDFGSTNQTTRSRRREPGMGVSTDYSSENTQQKLQPKKINQREMNNDEIEIPEIPDLEEQVDASEDMAFKVAEAPDVQVHQISTYKELDKEFFKEKAFQFLEGNIDVSLLHCGLNTEQQIAEEADTIWEWGKLFTEVVSVLTVNKETDLFSDSEQPGVGDEDANAFKTSTGKRERDLTY